MRNPISRLVSHIFGDRPGHVGVLVATAALAACGTVYTPEPVGNLPVQLDPRNWDGVWVESPADGRACMDRSGASAVGETPPDCLTLTVIAPTEGLLMVRSESGAAAKVWVRSVAPVAGPVAVGTAFDDEISAVPDPGRSPRPWFVTAENVEGTGDDRFELCCWVAMQSDHLVIWMAHPAVFRELIAQGTLPPAPGSPGRSAESAYLGHLDERALAVLAGPRRWSLFWWEDPLVLHRIGESEP